MENVEELKKTVEIFEAELKELEEKLKEKLAVDEKMKADYRRMEVLVSIENLTKYINRLEYIEKVRKYENSSRNA
ncbi:MAG: hypothetical protein KA277_07205 [Fusobacteriaceae bacterium]|jgi:hypothetical protein|nr:hypothetical protein [Fusobacteriaceae bacterium]MBP9595340.1 hypothetical protein [Fusobacteriaceae bacterium]